jgi:hypothetical protein
VDRLTVKVRVERREDVSARPAFQGKGEENVVVAQDGGYECALLYYIIGVAGEMRAKYRAADIVPPSRGGWVLMR